MSLTIKVAVCVLTTCRYLGAYGVDMVRFDGKLARVMAPVSRVRGTSSAIVSELADESKSVQVQFETKPKVKEGEVQPDVYAKVVVRPAEIYVCPPGLRRILGFFATGPDSNVIDFDAVRDAVGEEAKRQVRIHAVPALSIFSLPF
jgi:hypothetical protein